MSAFDPFLPLEECRLSERRVRAVRLGVRQPAPPKHRELGRVAIILTAGALQDVVQVRALEVRPPNRAQLARLMGLLHRPPRFEIAFEKVAALAELGPRLRTVNEHKINVVKSERL